MHFIAPCLHKDYNYSEELIVTERVEMVILWDVEITPFQFREAQLPKEEIALFQIMHQYQSPSYLKSVFIDNKFLQYQEEQNNQGKTVRTKI